jgi:murein DD-endopeptidase MepM/ murein hydrolase activator NlpD
MIQKWAGLSLFFLIQVTLIAVDTNRISNLMQSEKWSEAEAELKTAVGTASPEESVWLYTSLIYVLNSQSKSEEAIQTGRFALKKNPNSTPLKESVSLTLVKQGASFLEMESKYKDALKICQEAYEIQENETTTIWYGIALAKNKKLQEAVNHFIKAKVTYPNQTNISRNLAYTQFDYGIELLNQKDYPNAEKNLKQAYDSEKKDFMLYHLAIVLRDQQKFDQSIALIQEGIKKFPSSELIKNTLPYTKFLKFNSLLNSQKDYGIIKNEILETLNLLRKEKKFKDQYYYQRIVIKGVEYIGDISFHETVFKTLTKIFPNDPDVYDEYGFTYYTIKSKDGQASKEDRITAINFRKKAIDLYESQNPNRKEILNVSYPLIGKYEIIAEFGGSAMTHNGLAKYCYDFIAVDESGEYVKKGKSGKVNEDYFNFNQPLFAVAEGEVIDLLLDQPDNEPGKYARSGNYISIQHADFIAFYAHLKKESSLLKIGQKVKKGDLIARAGNSGMSRESHLHFCLNDSNWVSLPFRFKEHKTWKENRSRITTDPIHEGEIVEFESP